MGVDELIGCCTSGMEVGDIITEEIQVGSHGLVIQVVKVRHIFHIVPQNSSFERVGEEQNEVVGWRWRTVDGGRGWRSGRTSITVVYGVVQVANMIGWCAADRTVLMRASRCSGAGSGRLLAGSLSISIGIGIGSRIHAEFVSVDLV